MEQIDLAEFFRYYLSKIIIVVIGIGLMVVVGNVYSLIARRPLYESNTTIVLASESKDSATYTQNDLQLNQKLVSTYSELIKRNVVLGQVATNLNIPEAQIQDMKGKIKVSAVKNTEIIEISVANKDPNQAALIANEIAKVFSEKIVEIYNISNVYVLDRAEANAIPSNINHTKDTAVFAFIGLVVAAVYVLIATMLDNTIKTEQDVENATGLLILSSIPNYDIELKNKRGK